jgi:peptide/nickel transport system permease protein
MRPFLIRRILALLPVILIVGTIVFMLVHLTPGDPASYMLGPDATQADIDRLRTAMGLNQPLLVQYAKWMGHAVQGDLGKSIFLQKPVLAAIGDRLEPTLLLTLFATGIAVGIGLPLGILAATHRNTWIDQFAMAFAMLGVSIPSFWLGLNLIMLVSVKWHLLPVAGYSSLARDGLGVFKYLVMPAFSLGVIEAALIARMTRSSMLEILRQDYVRTARAKGLKENRVTLRHALRNAAIPILTVVGNTMAVLMGGAIVTETVFNIPGLGRLVIQSVLRRDYPLLQGAVLFIAAVYVLINLVVDLVYAVVDPRIRFS